jgi:protoporphyrinogen oxidase
MKKVIIIGAGYTGLSAALEFIESGYEVEIIEADATIGGLAGVFEFEPGIFLEKFYHHWFTSDTAVLDLIDSLGLTSQLEYKNSNTGLFYVNSVFRLSSPLDLLSFSPLPFVDRIRVGLLALYARRISNWKSLEDISAADWIKKIGGSRAFEIIWKPLLIGKFGSEWENVSAVWFWNKLKLRGGSRGKGASEQLVYFKGGFGALTNSIQKALLTKKVTFTLNSKVEAITHSEDTISGVKLIGNDTIKRSDLVFSTVPLPIHLKFFGQNQSEYIKKYSQIRFLGNCCLVLKLKQSLSNTYWLNIADPTFPFVGIIEHTNFDSKEHYNNHHIAYISKYLSTKESLFAMEVDEFWNYCVPYIKKIFPEFCESWVLHKYLWKAEYSQPVIEKNYSSLIPPHQGPYKNLWLATMAQVYPEDRGTNYAVRLGKEVAKKAILENQIS